MVKTFIMSDYLVENNYGGVILMIIICLCRLHHIQQNENFIEVMNIHALPSNIWHYEMTDEGGMKKLMKMIILIVTYA